MRYKYYMVVAGAMCVAGCVMVGLKHWGNIEEPRAQIQQQRGSDIVQLTNTISEALPEDSPTQVTDSVQVVRDLAVDVQTDAVKSERWAAAGKKIMGPPHDDVKPNTTGEDGVLAQHEQVAETMGKARTVVNTGRAILSTASSGGGLGGLATGGGLALIMAAVGTATEIGRRKLKEQERHRKTDQETSAEEHRKTRAAAETQLREIQDERDRQQDAKMDVMTAAINERIAKLEELLKGKA